MFKDKVVVITGSTQGIGFRTAELLAQRGAHVVINSRNEEKVNEAVSRLQEKGMSVLGVAGDVSNIEFCNTLRNNTVDTFGRIDYLINNAGLAAKGRLTDTQAEVYQQLYNVNVLGSLNPTISMLNDIKESRGGILFIASLAGIVGLPSYSAYSGTKGSIVKLAESFKNELLDDGVFVGLNYPGFTENDPNKTTIKGNGESVVMTKRTDVKVEPLDKTVGRIISQIEGRKFRAFSSSKGWWVHFMYRMSPSLALFILKKNRHKIMDME